MADLSGGGRVAGDPGFVGSVIGLAVSVVVFAVLMGLSIWMDLRREAAGGSGCSCLLRLVALLVLTFGLGVGYLLGRAWGG